MFILPASAGDGACSTWQSRAALGCTASNGCTSWFRSANTTFWNQAIGSNLGLLPAAADTDLNGVADGGAGDLSDPTAPSSTPWKRFNAVYRAALDWYAPALWAHKGRLRGVG